MWTFIRDQILGMRWLNALIEQLLLMVGLNLDSRIGGSIQFFIYDTIKITVLLCVLIFLISYIQSFFPPERSRKISSAMALYGSDVAVDRVNIFLYQPFFC